MVRVVESLPAAGRVLRRPQHSFHIRHRPFQIQPFALCPVLPGETLKNALLQARIVSDPIKSSLVGWWYEMYLFYVKHRDMPNSQHFQNMVLQYGYDLSPAFSGADEKHYHPGNTVDWAEQCLRAVVPYYFRDDNERYDECLWDGLPIARINTNSWLDSALLDSQNPSGQAIPAGTSASATDLLLQQFELMRELKLTTMTYEEFLRTYGVRPDQAVPANRPELVRYVRDWNYPSNTVNPVDGSAASAMSWSVAERADKDRYFAEPGFLFGCCVARPKVYYTRQSGAGSQMLTDALAWLPAIMNSEPQTSRKHFNANTGPVKSSVEGYWVDVRDLFLYGDQFVNFAPAVGEANGVSLPNDYVERRYASAADTDALFKSPTSNKVRADGILSLTIAGSQRDAT